jgi:hypothetical protein
MIAFHFPPWRGSSGSLRTLNFSRYLPQYGWKPIILTAHPWAYPDVEPESVSQVSPAVIVKRVFALDAARHLSLNGRYFDCTAIPDRWGSWLLGGIPSALAMIRKYKPRVLWSTYPISTAHVIGAILRRLTGIPWIADFRDPMVSYDAVKNEHWPREPKVRKARMWVERLVVKYSTRAVFVAPGALRVYAERFPHKLSQYWVLIPNGYDEESFLAAETVAVARTTPQGQIFLLHSGGLYPGSGRDPSAFFSAIAALRDEGELSPTNFKVSLRGGGTGEQLRQLIAHYRLEELVFLDAVIPYRNALAEMLHADGLVLFQGPLTNTAIPAKLYEYLRARRPILAFVDTAGDSAALLRSIGVGEIVPLDEKERIVVGLRNFLTQIRLHSAPVAEMSQVIQFSRQSSTQDLARLFDEVGQ